MRYVRANYKISEEDPTYCKLLFNVGGGRSQWIFLVHVVMAGQGDDWVQLESPIGIADRLPLLSALQYAGDRVVGGLVVRSDLLWLRHSVPLANLDTNEFERPLHLVLGTADELERQYVGTDLL